MGKQSHQRLGEHMVGLTGREEPCDEFFVRGDEVACTVLQMVNDFSSALGHARQAVRLRSSIPMARSLGTLLQQQAPHRPMQRGTDGDGES